MTLAELEIARVNWSCLREAGGSAGEIGVGLAALLSASSSEQIEAAYWRLENHVVVQGEVFEVAEATVSVLVASLADRYPSQVRVAVLELLFQIVNGAASPGEITAGNHELLERCHARCREGFWLLVREFVEGQPGALEVLEVVCKDPRLHAIRSWGRADSRRE